MSEHLEEKNVTYTYLSSSFSLGKKGGLLFNCFPSFVYARCSRPEGIASMFPRRGKDVGVGG